MWSQHTAENTTQEQVLHIMSSFCGSGCFVYHTACDIIKHMGYQIGPFELGQIKAHVEHGLGCIAIAKRSFKADGKTCYSETAVHKAMCKLVKVPGWRGEREERSGAPRKSTRSRTVQLSDGCCGIVARRR